MFSVTVLLTGHNSSVDVFDSVRVPEKGTSSDPQRLSCQVLPSCPSVVAHFHAFSLVFLSMRSLDIWFSLLFCCCCQILLRRTCFWFLRRRNGKNVRSPTPVDGNLDGVIRSEGWEDGSTWPSITHGAGSTRAALWKGAQKPTKRSKRLTNEVSYLRHSKQLDLV